MAHNISTRSESEWQLLCFQLWYNDTKPVQSYLWWVDMVQWHSIIWSFQSRLCILHEVHSLTVVIEIASSFFLFVVSFSRFHWFSSSLIFSNVHRAILRFVVNREKRTKVKLNDLMRKKFHSFHVSYDSDNKINGGIITSEYLIDTEVSKSRSTSLLSFPPQLISAFIACLLYSTGRFLKFNKSSFHSHTQLSWLFPPDYC